MLAAIAASTSRIRLGPLVAATAFHAPAMLAKLAATVDEVSGGRLDPRPRRGLERDRVPRRSASRSTTAISRFEEAFTIIRTLLREGRIDFDGRFFQARDCALLPRAGAARRAAAHGRQQRAADARDHAAARRAVERLVPPVGQLAGGPRADAPATSTRPAARVGRDPATLEKTSAVLVAHAGRQRAASRSTTTATIAAGRGLDAREIAARLREYAASGSPRSSSSSTRSRSSPSRRSRPCSPTSTAAEPTSERPIRAGPGARFAPE